MSYSIQTHLIRKRTFCQKLLSMRGLSCGKVVGKADLRQYPQIQTVREIHHLQSIWHLLIRKCITDPEQRKHMRQKTIQKTFSFFLLELSLTAQ